MYGQSGNGITKRKKLIEKSNAAPVYKNNNNKEMVGNFKISAQIDLISSELEPSEPTKINKPIEA